MRSDEEFLAVADEILSARPLGRRLARPVASLGVIESDPVTVDDLDGPVVGLCGICDGPTCHFKHSWDR